MNDLGRKLSSASPGPAAPPAGESAPDRAKGTVYVELRVEKRLALSRAVRGWTEAEIEELLSGDRASREALKEEMAAEAFARPDDYEVEFLDIRVGEKRL